MHPARALRRLPQPLLAIGLLCATGQAHAQAGASTAEAQAMQLRSLAATCAQCHGTDGRSAVENSLVPPLAGLPESRFRERMAAFRSEPSGAPGATVMPQLAKGFSAAQIAQLAAWFAAQPR
jgi:sulfide dehydrogenase cytochrome subunit